jgi:hypothetical protein
MAQCTAFEAEQTEKRYDGRMLLPLMFAAVALSPMLPAPAASDQPQATPPSPAAPAAEPRWNWSKGQATRYIVKQSTEARGEGMLAYFLTQIQEQRILVKVADVSPTGEATLELTLESISISIATAEGAPPIVISSSAEPAKEEFDPSAPCRAMVGLTLTIILSPEGETREIRGLDALKTRVRRAFAEPASLAAVATDLLGALTEDRLRSSLQPAFLLSSTDSPSAPQPLAMKGLGTLSAQRSRATRSSGGLVVAHRTTDFALATPNTDEIAKTFDVVLTDAREECESTLDPATGKIRKVSSTMTMLTTLTPKSSQPGMATTTRRFDQTMTIEPAPDDKATTAPPATPREEPGKP